MTIFISNKGKGELEVFNLLKLKNIEVELFNLESGDYFFNGIDASCCDA